MIEVLAACKKTVKTGSGGGTGYKYRSTTPPNPLGRWPICYKDKKTLKLYLRSFIKRHPVCFVPYPKGKILILDFPSSTVRSPPFSKTDSCCRKTFTNRGPKTSENTPCVRT